MSGSFPYAFRAYISIISPDSLFCAEMLTILPQQCLAPFNISGRGVAISLANRYYPNMTGLRHR